MKTERSMVRAALAVALAVSVGGTSPSIAAEPAYGALGNGADGPAQGTGRRLDLSIGRSVVIELTRDAKEIFVANPAVANAVVRSARKLFLLGVANGATSVFVMDAEGRQIASLEVNVGRDLSVLRQTLRATIPTGRIDIRPAGDSILLTGTVSSASDAQQAVDIAKAFVGQSTGGGGGGGAAGGAGGSGGGAAGGLAGFSGSVINALTIAGRDQVMLRVSVVEVARSVTKQLGVNLGGNWNVVETAAGAAGAAIAKANPASSLVGFASGAIGALNGANGTSIQGQYGSKDFNVGGTLTALERAGVARVLAEPTLVAVSGESASFLVGGEIPIPVYSCTTTAAAGCVPTITYKPFGISLNFTPIVLSEGRISLKVFTEVSEIDRENSVGDTPGFRTRKTSTSIELPSGATLMSAGLISATSSNAIKGVPGLINLPILGTLFRSRDYQRRESELMIMVTPFIAKPMEAAQAKRPDDGFVDSTDQQAVLMGRFNKLYGVAGPAPANARAERGGRFGFITD